MGYPEILGALPLQGVHHCLPRQSVAWFFGHEIVPKIGAFHGHGMALGVPSKWMVFLMENPTKMDDNWGYQKAKIRLDWMLWGYPHSWKPPMCR